MVKIFHFQDIVIEQCKIHIVNRDLDLALCRVLCRDVLFDVLDLFKQYACDLLLQYVICRLLQFHIDR